MRALADGRFYVENPAPAVVEEFYCTSEWEIIPASDRDKLISFCSKFSRHKRYDGLADGLLHIITYENEAEKESALEMLRMWDWESNLIRVDKPGPGKIEVLAKIPSI